MPQVGEQRGGLELRERIRKGRKPCKGALLHSDRETDLWGIPAGELDSWKQGSEEPQGEATQRVVQLLPWEHVSG